VSDSPYEQTRNRLAFILRTMYGPRPMFYFGDGRSYEQFVADAILRDLMNEAQAQKQLPPGQSLVPQKDG